MKNCQKEKRFLGRSTQPGGNSLLPLIKGETSARSEVFTEQYFSYLDCHWEAVRTEQYSYTRYIENDDAMRFDIVNDPFERQNLRKSNPDSEIIKDLEKRFEKLHSFL